MPEMRQGQLPATAPAVDDEGSVDDGDDALFTLSGSGPHLPAQGIGAEFVI
jgi:hypothetical protein